MPDKKKQSQVQQTAIGDGNVQIVGDKNVVNQTIIQKFFNIFKSDAETVDQRNRRIMLGHVENFWVKGILEKSLHGAALLELGIKEDPDALNYPWAIKREANKETLPAGTSMLEIFQEIGMGRSLLILGAPGSGKTTMLLELTRQLIERAREDVTEPIPVVFNLSSWKEKLTLADWLARELNIIYTIPKKVAPTWVKENKMLLLLDGLDEVRQESRDQCVEAINHFRKENGLTSVVVCSRSQDYDELKARLYFDGAIEIQSLTANQVDEYFMRFGEGLAGIRQVMEKDTVLREMAETPLFLSIMTLAYRGKDTANILVFQNIDDQRKYLFDTYIERMFERSGRSKNEIFNNNDVLHWLSWLAQKMIAHNSVPYILEDMQPWWLIDKKEIELYWSLPSLPIGLFAGAIMSGVIINGIIELFDKPLTIQSILIMGILFLVGWIYIGYVTSLSLEAFDRYRHKLLQLPQYLVRFVYRRTYHEIPNEQLFQLASSSFLLKKTSIATLGLGDDRLFNNIELVNNVRWGRQGARYYFLYNVIACTLISILAAGVDFGWTGDILKKGAVTGLSIGVMLGLLSGYTNEQIDQTSYPGQKLSLSIKNSVYFFLTFGSIMGISIALVVFISYREIISQLNLILIPAIGALVGGLISGGIFGGFAILHHLSLRIVLARNNHLPLRIVPFLNHCVDLIFLRRVGGGYIFIHRLLMEHFADMYPADEK